MLRAIVAERPPRHSTADIAIEVGGTVVRADWSPDVKILGIPTPIQEDPRGVYVAVEIRHTARIEHIGVKIRTAGPMTQLHSRCADRMLTTPDDFEPGRPYPERR